MKKEIKFPFNKKGLMHYSWYAYPILKDNDVLEWKDYFEFEDILFIDDYHKGRSSVIINLKSTTDQKEYPIFLKDFWEILKNVNINDRLISGRWGMHKKGNNYGIFLCHLKN